MQQENKTPSQSSDLNPTDRSLKRLKAETVQNKQLNRVIKAWRRRLAFKMQGLFT